jgi:hypothetical protein
MLAAEQRRVEGGAQLGDGLASLAIRAEGADGSGSEAAWRGWDRKVRGTGALMPPMLRPSRAVPIALVLLASPAVAHGQSTSACASSATEPLRLTGSGAALEVALPQPSPATAGVTVLQQSRGSRVIGERVLTRLTARAGVASYDGPAADGVYVVRYGTGAARRRAVVLRSGGTWRLRPADETAGTCGVLTSVRTDRPVFGGRSRRSLTVKYRLSAEARVRIDVLRGGRIVGRTQSKPRRAGVTYSIRIPATGLSRGDHRVRVTATRDGESVTATVVSRRI